MSLRRAVALVGLVVVVEFSNLASTAEAVEASADRATRIPAPGTARFGYLFPALKDRPDCLLPYREDGGLDPVVQSLLKELAREMESPATIDEDSKIPAGMTYLGQFIVHDISFDATSKFDRIIDPYAIENVRTRGLYLDSVYGRGPLVQPYLYERVDGSETAGARLLFGHRLNPADLTRDTGGRVTGRAIIGDPRNDDNLIVSQLHLAFVSFHNAVVERLAPRISDPYELFVAASTQVRQHYQWLVLHGFLRTIADPSVVDAVIASPCDELCHAPGPSIPVEFSMGAFRFGHSMVRPFYTIAAGKTASLQQIRREFTFRNPLTAGVPIGWVVDWAAFFWAPGARPTHANVARKIDTHVTPGLPTEATFLRAYAAKVPSGQCVAAALNVPRLTSDQLRSGHSGTVLQRQAGILLERTPLWYYVLKEAEVMERGERLGPLGSRLVAEVLVNLLRAERRSILNTAGWEPTLGPRRGEFGMRDFLCISGRLSPCPQ